MQDLTTVPFTSIWAPQLPQAAGGDVRPPLRRAASLPLCSDLRRRSASESPPVGAALKEVQQWVQFLLLGIGGRLSNASR